MSFLNKQKMLILNVPLESIRRLERLVQVTEADNNSQVISNALRLFEILAEWKAAGKNLFVRKDDRFMDQIPLTKEIAPSSKTEKLQVRLPKNSWERFEITIKNAQVADEAEVIVNALTIYEKLITANNAGHILFIREPSGQLSPFRPFDAPAADAPDLKLKA